MQTKDFEYEKTKDGIRLTKYIGDAVEVELPDSIDGEPVRILGSHAFFENGSNIERIKISGSIRIIEPYACEFCMSLRDLELSEGNEVIGREAFIATQQEELYLPSTIRWIEEPGELNVRLRISDKNPWYFSDGKALFRKTEDGGISLETMLPEADLTAYEIPEGTTAVARQAFDNQDGLESLIIPSSVTELAEGVLSNPKGHFSRARGIYKIRIAPDNPVYFKNADGIYKRLSDQSLELVKYLGQKAEIVLGDQILVIGQGAFARSHLKKITIPATVKKICQDAFLDCPIEEAVFQAWGFALYFPAVHPYLLKRVLEGFGQNGRIYDFDYYDRMLTQDALNAEKIRMICCRLSHPRDLSEERKKLFFERISQDPGQCVDLLAAKNDLRTVKQMTELGFFTQDNIDEIMEQVSRAGKMEVMAVLMDYKNRCLGHREFDFSL